MNTTTNKSSSLAGGLNVLSPFNGISCGRVALERVGIKVNRYVSYEIDDAANEVSKFNYPNDEYNGDVFEADFNQYKGFDLLIGGSPCTYWSIAKAGDNRETTSEGFGFELFMQYVRALRESGCKWFIYENNASISPEIQKEISKQLGVQPIEIDSADFSAQIRKRLYWTNIPILPLPTSCDLVLKDIMDEQVEEKFYYDKPFTYHGDDKKVCATLHINGHDILKRVNNKNFKSPTLTSCRGGNLQKKVYENGRCRKLTPNEYRKLQTIPEWYKMNVSNSQIYNMCGDGWTINVVRHIFRGLKNL